MRHDERNASLQNANGCSIVVLPDDAAVCRYAKLPEFPLTLIGLIRGNSILYWSTTSYLTTRYRVPGASKIFQRENPQVL
jgi:hypothetical protein